MPGRGCLLAFAAQGARFCVDPTSKKYDALRYYGDPSFLHSVLVHHLLTSTTSPLILRSYFSCGRRSARSRAKETRCKRPSLVGQVLLPRLELGTGHDAADWHALCVRGKDRQGGAGSRQVGRARLGHSSINQPPITVTANQPSTYAMQRGGIYIRTGTEPNAAPSCPSRRPPLQSMIYPLPPPPPPPPPPPNTGPERRYALESKPG